MRILWIEDVREEILPVIRRFHELKIALTLHPQVESALGFMNAEAQWNLIILDSFFPRQQAGASHSGVLLFQDLRNGKYGDWGRIVPIVFVTGYADVVAGMVQQYGDKQPLAIIPKPAKVDEVTRLLDYINAL